MNMNKIFTQMTLFVLLVLIIPSASIAGDFTDNQDGTISDNKTGLMWIQASSDNKMTFKEALTYCENLDKFGYMDWRLPNIKELKSIIHFTWDKPAIDTNYFPDTISTKYWSSTSYSNNKSKAWAVDFGRGGKNSPSVKASTYYVRAVRGGILKP